MSMRVSLPRRATPLSRLSSGTQPGMSEKAAVRIIRVNKEDQEDYSILPLHVVVRYLLNVGCPYGNAKRVETMLTSGVTLEDDFDYYERVWEGLPI